MKHRASILFFILLTWQLPASAFTINIQIPEESLHNATVQTALKDFKQLLTAATRDSIYVNSNLHTELVMELPAIMPTRLVYTDHDTSVYAQRAYSWKGGTKNNAFHLVLTTANQYGFAAALYGLLQDILNFSFYHPREMKTPDLSTWPLTDGFEYSSAPRYDVMGFHLHTEHPIELTEAFLNENYPNGEQVIKEYIDWLARNRQNYFEFNLLENIHRKHWMAYAKKWVDYAHERGVMAGVDLSLHMIQQKTFQLYRFPFKSFRTKKSQIHRNVEMLCQVPWNAWNVEFSTTEFSKGNKKKKQKLQLFLLEELKKKNVKLMGREHVVKEEKMISHKVQAGAHFDSAQVALDRERTILVHTVMFYTLFDTFAPVYGNENLLHMQRLLRQYMKERETWYYPESAYWITFDNSVPLFLPSYLSARLGDILFCDTLNVKGHITFSSGWEWGYWLFDWSIANWCWKTTIRHQEVKPDPLQYVRKVIPDEQYQSYFQKQLQLHDTWVKGKNLIRFLDAQTVTDEMPGKFNLPLHPRPEWTYKWLRRKASEKDLDTVQQEAQMLADLYLRFDSLDKTRSQNATYGSLLTKEFNDGFAIDKARTRHRYYTLNYLIAKRRSILQHEKCESCDSWMKQAVYTREAALQIVKNREAAYRYPIAEIAMRHRSHTAYSYGYLYPVHELHFWKREEQQALKNKWSPLFMSIWNIARIIGLID